MVQHNITGIICYIIFNLKSTKYNTKFYYHKWSQIIYVTIQKNPNELIRHNYEDKKICHHKWSQIIYVTIQKNPNELIIHNYEDKKICHHKWSQIVSLIIIFK